MKQDTKEMLLGTLYALAMAAVVMAGIAILS